MPKISVIVPVYNTEQCLSRCIDSILSQTFTDFELILINDGSTDNSGKICDEYAQKDSRITVIHKGNEGVSTARNKGIDIAQGEWVTFVDSDDFIPIEYLSEFIFDADLVVCGVKMWGNIEKNVSPYNSYINRDKIGMWLSDNYNGLYITSVYSKMFKLRIISNFKIRFNHNLKLGEDTDFIYRYLSNCNSLRIQNNPLYFYYISPNDVQQTKYKLTTHEYYTHVKSLTEAIYNLENSFRFNLDKLKFRLYDIYLSYYYSYIHSISFKTLKYEMKLYNKYKLIKFCGELTKKEFIYLKIISKFPCFLHLYKKTS